MMSFSAPELASNLGRQQPVKAYSPRLSSKNHAPVKLWWNTQGEFSGVLPVCQLVGLS